MKFHKASKRQSKLRLALIGPSGSGKTYSSLAVGTELVPGGRVAVIDTERGSASLYADRFSFDTLDLERHSPDDYVEAIKAAESEGYDSIIIDSLSHAWVGRDGALELHDKAMKRSGSTNSFTAWRDITPKHNRLVDAMISSRCHIIATVRSKVDYVVERDERTGKSAPKKIGLAPVQREGLDYEFTIVGEINHENVLTITKTRLSTLAGAVIERPGAALAKTIRDWLDSGETVPRVVTAETQVLDAALDDVFHDYLERMSKATTISELNYIAGGAGAPAKDSPNREVALTAYHEHKARIQSA